MKKIIALFTLILVAGCASTNPSWYLENKQSRNVASIDLKAKEAAITEIKKLTDAYKCKNDNKWSVKFAIDEQQLLVKGLNEGKEVVSYKIDLNDEMARVGVNENANVKGFFFTLYGRNMSNPSELNINIIARDNKFGIVDIHGFNPGRDRYFYCENIEQN